MATSLISQGMVAVAVRTTGAIETVERVPREGTKGKK
jgi:hypothetical protein